MNKEAVKKTRDLRLKTQGIKGLISLPGILSFVTWLIFTLTAPVLAASESGSQGVEADVIDLDEIVVSATRTPASLDSVSVSSSIIPEKQILSSTATDLSHLLGTAWLWLFGQPLELGSGAAFFRVQPGEAMPIWSVWAALIAVCLLSLWLLARKVKGVEIVS